MRPEPVVKPVMRTGVVPAMRVPMTMRTMAAFPMMPFGVRRIVVAVVVAVVVTPLTGVMTPAATMIPVSVMSLAAFGMFAMTATIVAAMRAIVIAALAALTVINDAGEVATAGGVGAVAAMVRVSGA